MEITKLVELGIAAATGKIPAEYSASDVNETLREELKAFNSILTTEQTKTYYSN